MLKAGVLGIPLAVTVKYLLYNNRYFKDPKDKVKNNIIDVLSAFFGIHFYQFTPGWVSFLGGEVQLILREKFRVGMVNPIPKVVPKSIEDALMWSFPSLKLLLPEGSHQVLKLSYRI